MYNNTISALELESLASEVVLLGFLGKVLYTEPNREWLQQLTSNQIFSEAPFGAEQEEIQHGLELLQNWSLAHKKGISDDEYANLNLDYARLFIGLESTHPSPPWGSVYLDRERLVFQQSTQRVRAWYQRFNLEPEQINKEPDDHIALELIFMARLAKMALETTDKQKYIEYLTAQRDFLHENLLRWGPSWAKLVKQHAQTDFYRGMAYLVHGTLLAIADMLEIVMPKEVAL